MSIKDIQFQDWKKKIEGNLGKEEFITVYEINETHFEWATFYCALIPNDRVEKSLTDPSWDLSIGNGFPGFVFHFENGKKVGKYYRFSGSGVEPLIFWRGFHGIKEGYPEVSEEFRHHFNLYEDRRKNKFIVIDDNGDEEDVVLMADDKIQIKLKYIKEFLAVKKMHLAIFFDFARFSEKTIEELGIKEFHENVQKDNYVYSVGARNWDVVDDNKKSHGWLMGKKLITGLKDFEPKLFGEEERKFEDFIIDIDEDGNEVLNTCEGKKLANFFGKNKGAPYYVTPVFFRKEVLTKYYSQPEKYSVEDGCLYCGGLWSLRMDNNHPDYVMVFLGDLGYLSHKEQLHWKSYNIAHKGRMSYTAWARNFKAEFTDSERSDLFFKQKFRSFQEDWKKKFGWQLFKPLLKDDEHHFKTLRVPLTNEQKEFDEQVLSLTKVLIDSLNEKELVKGINITKENAKGIDKLEIFLNSKHVHFNGLIEFLRDLQELRSTGVAHLKGKRYEKIKKEFLIGEKELPEVFDDILINAIWTLNSLENYVLKKE